MSDRFFLYIDILGFTDLVKSGSDISELYHTIDRLNVHGDDYFTCIVFSDTIIVYAADEWLRTPNSCIMWLIEFAQDLFYRLIVKDIHFRAYITFGNFEHYKLKNLEAYYGKALIDCHEREKTIKCTGVFLDARLFNLSDIFHLTRYDDNSFYVHVMQHLEDVSGRYDEYPITGELLEATGMEWWVAYLLHYLKNVYSHMNDQKLDGSVRLKFANSWRMLKERHRGLLSRLEESNFKYQDVIQMDWTEPMRRIGTEEGAWG